MKQHPICFRHLAQNEKKSRRVSLDENEKAKERGLENANVPPTQIVASSKVVTLRVAV